MCVYVYAGTINRPLRLRTACQLRGEHSANTQRPPTKCPQNIPPGVGADSSRPYPNITKYTYPHYQIRISTLPHTHFPSHFVCVYVYTGTINRPLRLRTACQLRGEHSANTQRPPTKCLTNTPPGVGADSSRPYPNITKHTHSHHRTRISPPHYVCVHVYAGTINRPLQLLTACNNAADDLQQRCERFTNNVTPTHEMPTKHSARRRGRFIAPVS